MSTDARLFCVFRTAGKRPFSSKMDLAREIERGQHIEFSTERDGERTYMQANAIADYVTFCTLVGVLGEDMKPYVPSNNSKLQGFQHALADKIEDFASRQGFSVERIRSAVRDLLGQTPARLPTPRAVFAAIKPSCDYHIFYKAVTVQAYQARVNAHVRQRATFVIEDILRAPDGA